jgi:hypothetical protein
VTMSEMGHKQNPPGPGLSDDEPLRKLVPPCARPNGGVAQQVPDEDRSCAPHRHGMDSSERDPLANSKTAKGTRTSGVISRGKSE